MQLACLPEPRTREISIALTSHLMWRHSSERRSEFFGHDVDRSQTIDSIEQSLRAIVLRNRRSLSAINLQPGLENLSIIVTTNALAVVRRLLGAACYTIAKRIFVDFQLKDRIEFDTPGCEFLVERFRLCHSSRETVEYKAVCRVRMIDAIDDDRNHDVVGHEFSAVHDVFGADSRGRARGHRFAEHVSGRQLRDAKTRGDLRRLSTLSRAWRSQDNQSH